MRARDQSSIFSTGGKFRLLLELHALTLVARSYALLGLVSMGTAVSCKKGCRVVGLIWDSGVVAGAFSCTAVNIRTIWCLVRAHRLTSCMKLSYNINCTTVKVLNCHTVYMYDIKPALQ